MTPWCANTRRYEYDYVGAWDPAVPVGAEMAAVTARAMMLVSQRGNVKNRVPLLSTLVWIRDDDRWRLLRRHATRLPADVELSLEDDRMGKAWAESGPSTNDKDSVDPQPTGKTTA